MWENELDWPVLDFQGRLYRVAPRYIPGVGIAEAQALARGRGCILPTVAMVQAIYELADCKLDAGQFVRRHDGTARTMSSASVMADQSRKVDLAIAHWEALNGKAWLVAGTHKDVVYDTRSPTRGFALGLYGWQKGPDGKPIQPPFYGHSGAWKDYSQGARLVKAL